MPTPTPLDAKAVAALYDTDLFAWANTNAQLLRQGKYEHIDVGHLIEEIEDMGKSEQRSLASHLRNLLMHLLKWQHPHQHQPEIRSQSWQSSAINARLEIERLLQDSPSLRGRLPKLLDTEYAAARRLASVETALPLKTFAAACPYPLAQVLSEDWLPQ
jgi:Domain of unknown function DUF29